MEQKKPTQEQIGKGNPIISKSVQARIKAQTGMEISTPKDDKELRGEIARIVRDTRRQPIIAEKIETLEITDQILSKLKSSGWKSPQELKDLITQKDAYFEAFRNETNQEFKKLLSKAREGYVKLADDQKPLKSVKHPNLFAGGDEKNGYYKGSKE